MFKTLHTEDNILNIYRRVILQTLTSFTLTAHANGMWRPLFEIRLEHLLKVMKAWSGLFSWLLCEHKLYGEEFNERWNGLIECERI